jgi:hypothetical protein
VTDPYGGFWLQVFRTTGTLKNRKKIDRGRKNMILILGVANNDPIKMMES